MKKYIMLIATLLTCSVILMACGEKGNEEEESSEDQDLVEGEEIDSDEEQELPDVPENYEKQ